MNSDINISNGSTEEFILKQLFCVYTILALVKFESKFVN